MHRIILLFLLVGLSFPASSKAATMTAAGSSSYRGDVNEDGRISIFDLLGLLKIMSGKDVPGIDKQRQVANVDKSADGKINIFDLLALLKILAGKQEPELIYWGPPSIAGLDPSCAVSGDTLNVLMENLDDSSTVKVFLKNLEITPLETVAGNIKIVIPENYTGGMLYVTVGEETIDSIFLNTRNIDPPVIAGCRIFPDDNAWNQDISAFPVHPNSNNYVASIGLWVSLHPDFSSGANSGIPYVVVGGDQPRVPVSFGYADEADPGPYPIPEDAPIEGGSSSDGDRHILVLDSTNCMLYEVWRAFPEGPGWSTGGGAVFDLKSNALRPDTWTSADAAGLAILPGLVRYEEVAAGAINHAIRFTVSTSQRAYVYPATHYASTLTELDLPPMGLRFRLKASSDISKFSGQARVILEALKKYGMIVADNGGNWFISGVGDTRWNDNDLNELKKVTGNNFEAVDVSAMVVVGKEQRLNIRPGVSIAFPPADTTFSAPATIEITADAWDNDGTVVLVEFFQGTVKLGEDPAAPYEFTWSGIGPGTYSITARATDNGGQTNTSYHVTVTVSE